MSRRATLEIVEAHDVPASPLAEAWAAEEARRDAIDADRRDAVRVLADVDAFGLVAHTSPPRAPKPPRDPAFRWQGEIEALRSVTIGVQQRTGQLVGLQRRLNGELAPRGIVPSIPMGVDPQARAVADVVATLDPQAAVWLFEAYVELRPPRPKVAKDGRKGEGGTASSSAMTAADGEGMTWMELVADKHSMPVDAETLASIKAAVSQAKRALRVGLQRAGLIPPPSRREVERDQAPEIVVTCLGAVIVDGLRGECGEGQALAADVAASPRCERCGRPWGRA